MWSGKTERAFVDAPVEPDALLARADDPLEPPLELVRLPQLADKAQVARRPRPVLRERLAVVVGAERGAGGGEPGGGEVGEREPGRARRRRGRGRRWRHRDLVGRRRLARLGRGRRRSPAGRRRARRARPATAAGRRLEQAVARSERSERRLALGRDVERLVERRLEHLRVEPDERRVVHDQAEDRDRRGRERREERVGNDETAHAACAVQKSTLGAGRGGRAGGRKEGTHECPNKMTRTGPVPPRLLNISSFSLTSALSQVTWFSTAVTSSPRVSYGG